MIKEVEAKEKVVPAPKKKRDSKADAKADAKDSKAETKDKTDKTDKETKPKKEKATKKTVGVKTKDLVKGKKVEEDLSNKMGAVIEKEDWVLTKTNDGKKDEK